MVYILYFDPRPEGKDCAKVCLNFLGLRSVTKSLSDHKHLFTDAVRKSLDTVSDSTNDEIRESSISEERQSNTSTGNTTDSELTTRIMEELKDKGIQRKDIFKTLVGFGADGAAVNQGKKQSVKTLLLEKCPWLFFGWCFGHKLELSIEDAI